MCILWSLAASAAKATQIGVWGGVHKLIYNTREEMKLLDRCRGQIAGRQIRGETDA